MQKQVTYAGVVQTSTDKFIIVDYESSTKGIFLFNDNAGNGYYLTSPQSLCAVSCPKDYLHNGVIVNMKGASTDAKYVHEDTDGLMTKVLGLMMQTPKEETKDADGAVISKVYSNDELTIHLSITKLNYKKIIGKTPTPVRGAMTQQQRAQLLPKTKYADLERVLDMTWYKENGIVKKDYKVIKNDQDFVKLLVEPLTEYVKCNDDVLIGIDTETTGLNIWNLSKNNPTKSHIVTFQVSWKDNQGVIVFLDMEYFSNTTLKTAIDFLTGSFSRYGTIGGKKHGIDYFTTGHNAGFDRKTFWDCGSDVWFDYDTLQMSFNLCPGSFREGNGLKEITRKLFGHETPELEDLLGKNNKDMFKYLEDEELISVYGCADTDYSRMIWYKIRALMSDHLFEMYKQQDTILGNVLPVSEYYGLNTDYDKFVEQGMFVAQDIENLKDYAYSYVGRFLAKRQEKLRLENEVAAGRMTKELATKVLGAFDCSNALPYEFEFKPAELKRVTYEILGYPCYSYTEKGAMQLNKYCIGKLLDEANDGTNDIEMEPLVRTEISYEDYLGADDSDKRDMELIGAKSINTSKYPFAKILQVYSDINKEYTAYYKPNMDEDTESHIFKSYKMARQETRRIGNPSQTMKANLKSYTKSFNDDYYLLDFDMSQAEYRVMVSLAHDDTLINKMMDPEMDYHTETASMVHGIPAHKVTKKVRKHTKCISFGIPYGLGVASLSDTMFGDKTHEHVYETQQLMDKWKAANYKVIDFLEASRRQALTEIDVDDSFRDYTGYWEYDDAGVKHKIPLSVVTNALGFYRVFNLSGVEQTREAQERRDRGKFNSAEGSIRRKSGNYGIQSFAAELFRHILMAFYERCENEGYVHVRDVIWHMLIHDELLCSIKKNIHPLKIFEIVYESCMVKPKGHTNYFVGINMGTTWGECKDDAREAPVIFVQRMVKRWKASVEDGEDGEFSLKNTPEQYKRVNPETGEEEYWFNNPFDFLAPEMHQYFSDRIFEVITDIQGSTDVIDVRRLVNEFTNYTVRAFINDWKSLRSVDKSKYVKGTKTDGSIVYDDELIDNLKWQRNLEGWALERFGEDQQFIGVDGEQFSLRDVLENRPTTFLEVEGKNEDTRQMNVFNAGEAQSKHIKYSYGGVKKLPSNQLIITSIVPEEDIRRYLSMYSAPKGYTVMLKAGSQPMKIIGRVSDKIDLEDLNRFIGGK